MKFMRKTQRLRTPSMPSIDETVSVYPLVNELRCSTRWNVVLIALESAFWTDQDVKAAFDTGQDGAEQDLRSLQLDCHVVGRDMARAMGIVREELDESDREELPDPVVYR